MRRPWSRCLLAVMLASALGAGACGGRAGPAGRFPLDGAPASPDGATTPDDGSTRGDGGVTLADGSWQADGLVTGRACDLEGGCAPGYTCFTPAPGGYCLFGQPFACGPGRECPTGTACAPVPWSAISGVCMATCASVADCRPGYRCGYVELFPGEPGTPRSAAPVCWYACTYGMDQTCNDNPLIASLRGRCNADGTCTCLNGSEPSSDTGRCR